MPYTGKDSIMANATIADIAKLFAALPLVGQVFRDNTNPHKNVIIGLISDVLYASDSADSSSSFVGIGRIGRTVMKEATERGAKVARKDAGGGKTSLAFYSRPDAILNMEYNTFLHAVDKEEERLHGELDKQYRKVKDTIVNMVAGTMYEVKGLKVTILQNTGGTVPSADAALKTLKEAREESRAVIECDADTAHKWAANILSILPNIVKACRDIGGGKVKLPGQADRPISEVILDQYAGIAVYGKIARIVHNEQSGNTASGKAWLAVRPTMTKEEAVADVEEVCKIINGSDVPANVAVAA